MSIYEADLKEEGPLPRVTTEMLLTYRMVAIHWTRTVQTFLVRSTISCLHFHAAHPTSRCCCFCCCCRCAQADLTDSEYTLVANTVKHADGLDAQLMLALRGFPCIFHISMVPDVAGISDSVTDCSSELAKESHMEKLHAAEWSSKLAVLEAELLQDQQVLQKVSGGFDVLTDSLQWISAQKKMKQAEQARDAEQIQAHFWRWGPDTDCLQWAKQVCYLADLGSRESVSASALACVFDGEPS